MKILLAARGVDLAAWQAALAQHLPQAQSRIWLAGDTAPADYVLYWKEQIEALQARAGVKAIFNLGAGVDALLKAVRANPGSLAEQVPVVRLEDAGMARQMVEYSVYCALRYLRRFHHYEALARQGMWRPFETPAPADFVVGVLGAGQLGQPVAMALQALGFAVRIYSRSPKTIPGITSFTGTDALAAFATGANLVINLLPNTPETENILNAAFFSHMQHGSYLVNLARGAHVQDDDLLAALAAGQLERAALDVFREEPLPATHPFWHHPQIEITPHISARTLIAESAEQIAAKIVSCEQGGVLRGIDLQRGY
jgi:glyoxylate/hydroxypyruvate reductase A